MMTLAKKLAQLASSVRTVGCALEGAILERERERERCVTNNMKESQGRSGRKKRRKNKGFGSLDGFNFFTHKFDTFDIRPRCGYVVSHEWMIVYMLIAPERSECLQI